MITLFDTVLDYQNQAAAIRRRDDHYRANHYDEIRTSTTWKGAFDRFPEDRDGNDELAQYLWGNHHWRRARELARPRALTSVSGT